ncbi:hypothetical protein DFS34DRAFT_621139 [Phlyctochytrium arcticum]|nr:hypothetical protein DFS34DRAFT_621139 [Phlyctochytrium arcticum]
MRIYTNLQRDHHHMARLSISVIFSKILRSFVAAAVMLVICSSALLGLLRIVSMRDCVEIELPNPHFMTCQSCRKALELCVGALQPTRMQNLVFSPVGNNIVESSRVKVHVVVHSAFPLLLGACFQFLHLDRITGPLEEPGCNFRLKVQRLAQHWFCATPFYL